MQMKKKDVTSSQKVVGVAEYPEYDTLQEAVDAMTDKTILTLVNAQVRTNALNRVRANATGIPSRSEFEAQVLSLPENFEKLKTVLGDPNQFKILRDKLVDEARTKWLDEHPAAKAALEKENDED